MNMAGIRYIIIFCERTIGLFGSAWGGMFFVIERRMERNCMTTISTIITTKANSPSPPSPSRIVCDRGTPSTVDPSISVATAFVMGPRAS